MGAAAAVLEELDFIPRAEACAALVGAAAGLGGEKVQGTGILGREAGNLAEAGLGARLELVAREPAFEKGGGSRILPPLGASMCSWVSNCSLHRSGCTPPSGAGSLTRRQQ